MRITPKLVSVSILALSLAACGGPDDAPEEADLGQEVETPAEVDAADDAAVLDTEATEETSEEAGEDAEDVTEEAVEAAEESAAESESVAAATPPPMFAICSACHSVDAGANGLGPSLAGVGGAKAGHVSSFSYSDAMKDSGVTWNAANLDAFLKNPGAIVPGTSMGYGGMSNDVQRKAVVDYLMGL